MSFKNKFNIKVYLGKETNFKFYMDSPNELPSEKKNDNTLGNSTESLKFVPKSGKTSKTNLLTKSIELSYSLPNDELAEEAKEKDDSKITTGSQKMYRSFSNSFESISSKHFASINANIEDLGEDDTENNYCKKAELNKNNIGLNKSEEESHNTPEAM